MHQSASHVETFFRDILLQEPPPFVREFIDIQALRGHATLCPDDAGLVGMHPLLVPLTRAPGENGVVQGLLWQPPSIHMGGDCRWPLVEAVPSRDGVAHHYRLLAKNVAVQVNRIAAEADFNRPGTEETQNILQVVKSLSGVYNVNYVYHEGDVTKAGVDLRMFLLRKVCMFADLLQDLSTEHLSRGDHTAASVASARAADEHHGWGNGYWHQAQLMMTLDQVARAQEQAGAALQCPWSTLHDDGGPDRVLGLVAAVAGRSEEELVADAQRRAQDKQTAAIKSGQLMWPELAAEHRAIGLCDTVVAERLPWTAIGADLLPALLEEAKYDGAAALARVRFSQAASPVASLGGGHNTGSDDSGDSGGSVTAPVTPPSRVDVSGLCERMEQWQQYALLCEEAFGKADKRTQAAHSSAHLYATALQHQRASPDKAEADIVTELFWSLVSSDADTDTMGGCIVVLRQPEYEHFLAAVGYELDEEDLSARDHRWQVECTNVGADSSVGVTLEYFHRLYTVHGRNAWLDTAAFKRHASKS